jgi:hypothetical protein
MKKPSKDQLTASILVLIIVFVVFIMSAFNQYKKYNSDIDTTKITPKDTLQFIQKKPFYCILINV